MIPKRSLAILLSILMLVSLVACKKTADKASAGDFEASVSAIMDGMNLSREEAVAMLEILSSLGADERIEAIYSATDGDGLKYYKVWFGLHLMSVYLDGGNVASVYKFGEMVYPRLPDNEPNEEEDEEPIEPNEKEESIELNAQLVSITSPIKAGKEATIELISIPNAEHEITVKYTSGASTAKGLEPKFSDADGKISWTWHVRANVRPGEYTIVIRSGEATYKTTIVIEEAEEE